MTIALPHVRVEANETSRSAIYIRACDRCGVARKVRDPKAKKNLCADCTYTLSKPEQLRWAA